MKNGTPLVESHAKADQDDRIALGAVCIWQGDHEAAQFAHLMNTMVHLEGRSSEIACIRKDNLTLRFIQEPTMSYRIIEADVSRIKTTTDQELGIFPEQVEMITDFHWSQACTMVMDRDGSSESIRTVVGCCLHLGLKSACSLQHPVPHSTQNCMCLCSGAGPYLFPHFVGGVMDVGDGAVDSRVSHMFQTACSAMLRIVDQCKTGACLVALDIVLCVHAQNAMHFQCRRGCQ